MLSIDRIYRYRSLAAQRMGYCRLRIYQQRSVHVVLLTEVGNNPGQSITAGSEVIATGLAARFQLDPATTVWIEHWPAEQSDKRLADTFSAVKYTWSNEVASRPRWRRMTQEQVEKLVGSLQENLDVLPIS